jgi:hypothetical protein
MDHFGIGAAMQGIARIYFQSARKTGRTTSLVQSVKRGDRIVFTDSRQAEHVLRLCMERGVTVECIVVDPRTPELVFGRGTPRGRTLFDHVWVEQYYLNAIEQAQRDIDNLQLKASGDREARRTPMRGDEEMMKWL